MTSNIPKLVSSSPMSVLKHLETVKMVCSDRNRSIRGNEIDSMHQILARREELNIQSLLKRELHM